jgi:CDP-diacylglycerol--glycerol-3-phosphate 3-phosphatidyltransferase
MSAIADVHSEPDLPRDRLLPLAASLVACQHPPDPLRGRQNRGGSPISRIANLLSAYRLAAAPVAAGMALAGHRDAFFVLVIISVATDLIDGPIARWLGRDSEFGAKLDTIADACTLLAGLLGLYIFESDTFRPELPWLYVFLASYGAAAIACLAKFGVLPAYHLYLSKSAAFCADAFFVWLYLADYSRPFFLAVIGLGVLANFESLLVTQRLKRFQPDIGSLFLLRARERDGVSDKG